MKTRQGVVVVANIPRRIGKREPVGVYRAIKPKLEATKEKGSTVSSLGFGLIEQLHVWVKDAVTKSHFTGDHPQ